jgi:hypothetical protein
MALDSQGPPVVPDVDVQVLFLHARQLGADDILLALLRDFDYRLTLVVSRLLSGGRVVRRLWVLDETEEGVEVVEEATSERHG